MEEIDVQILNKNEYKIVKIDRIIFSSKRKTDWDGVEDYLKKYISHKCVIDETGDEIYIGSDFPDEYAHSKYSYKIFGTIAKAKANASQIIYELIKNAKFLTFVSNREEKHNIDAKNGWYSFLIHFLMPVFDDKGNKVGTNVFRGRMLIRCDSKGTKYLYDIIDIKKET